MEKQSNYKLFDRPKWWLPRVFKILAVVTLLITILSWAVSSILYHQIQALSAEDTPAELTSYFLDDVVSMSSDVLFVIVFLWLLAIAVDKLDQIVWLNATDEDRAEIIQKRKKKNAKN